MKSIILPLVWMTAVTSLATAQETPAQPPAVSPPAVRQPRPRVVQPPSPSSDVPSSARLETNQRIELTGSLGEKREIATTLTGIGPKFEASTFFQESGWLNMSFQISPDEKGNIVSYVISAQVPVPLGGNRIEYKEVTFKSVVLCQPGQTVVIYKNGSQSLSLTVSEAKPDEK